MMGRFLIKKSSKATYFLCQTWPWDLSFVNCWYSSIISRSGDAQVELTYIGDPTAEHFRVLVATFREKSCKVFILKTTWSLGAHVSRDAARVFPACARSSPWGRQLCSTGRSQWLPLTVSSHTLGSVSDTASCFLTDPMPPTPGTCQHFRSVSQTLTLEPTAQVALSRADTEVWSGLKK